MARSDHIDHKGLSALYDFWTKIKGDRIAPQRSDFTPIDLKPWLGNVMLVKIEHETGRFFVRLAGTNITHYLDIEFSSKYLDDVIESKTYEKANEGFQKIMAARLPTYFHGAFMEPPRRLRDYFSLILPFSSDGEIIDMAMIGLYIQKDDQFPVDINNLCLAISSNYELITESV